MKFACAVAHKPQSFVAGRNRQASDTNEMLLFALVRAIEMIGEAANGKSSETVASLPQISWKKIIGMRNRVIHGYQDLDHEIIWDTVTIQIPGLITGLEKILPSSE